VTNEGALARQPGRVGGTHSDQGKRSLFNGNERNQLVAGSHADFRRKWTHVSWSGKEQRECGFTSMGDPHPEITADLRSVSRSVQKGTFCWADAADNFAESSRHDEEVGGLYRALIASEGGSATLPPPGYTKWKKRCCR